MSQTEGRRKRGRTPGQATRADQSSRSINGNTSGNSRSTRRVRSVAVGVVGSPARAAVPPLATALPTSATLAPSTASNEVQADATLPPATPAIAVTVATPATLSPVRRRRGRNVLLWLLALLILTGGTASYIVVQILQTIATNTGKILKTPVGVRQIEVSSTLTTTAGGGGLGGEGNGAPAPIETVIMAAPSITAPINILLLGLDYRPLEEDTRADTQIIVHVDPANKSATMLSIPRDLYVSIPGFGYDRINGAYQKGDHNNRTTPGSVPGGGPGLAMSTIQSDFGIPIDYYAQVTFKGFEDVVNSLGGVTIDVQRPLVDNNYPLASNSYGSTRIYIPSGLQHMDGKTALEYARSRHGDNDLGRNSRQQQVLLALKQHAINFDLVTRLNDLANTLGDTLQTDLSDPSRLLALAQLSREITPASINTCRLDQTMVFEKVLPDGRDVLLPNWDVIRPYVAGCFADPKLSGEAARIAVQNGTLNSDAGKRVRDLLVERGLLVPDLSNAPDRGRHPRTLVIDYTEGQKPRTVEVITEELGLDPVDVLWGRSADAPLAEKTDGKPVDIVVAVGDDGLPSAPLAPRSTPSPPAR